MAVRYHHCLPLSDGAAYDRLVGAGGDHADRMGAYRQRALLQDDEILGQVASGQFRDGRGDRASTRIPIWNELERVFAFCRGCFWCSAGYGRLDCFLCRVDLPWTVDLRLGQAAQESSPSLCLGFFTGHRGVGLFYFGRQFVDATSRGGG